MSAHVRRFVPRFRTGKVADRTLDRALEYADSVLRRWPVVPEDPIVDSDDLRSEAFLAAWRAWERWHPERGMSLRSYILSQVQYALKETCRVHDPLGREGRKAYQVLMTVWEAAETAEERQRVEREEEALRRLPMSIEELQSDGMPLSRAKSPWGEAGVSEDAVLLRHSLQTAMKALPEPQGAVIRELYFEGWSGAEVARRWGVSESWISRLRRAALRALQELLEPDLRAAEEREEQEDEERSS